MSARPPVTFLSAATRPKTVFVLSLGAQSLHLKTTMEIHALGFGFLKKGFNTFGQNKTNGCSHLVPEESQTEEGTPRSGQEEAAASLSAFLLFPSKYNRIHPIPVAFANLFSGIRNKLFWIRNGNGVD